MSVPVNALDLEGRAGAPERVPKLVETPGQFIAIDGGAVMDGVKHGGGLQRLPAVLGVVPGAVEQDEMRVQLGVEGARGRVQEGRADQVAGDAIPSSNASPCGCAWRRTAPSSRSAIVEASLMGLDDAPVIHRDGKNGTDLGGAHWKSKKCAAVPETVAASVAPSVIGCMLSHSRRNASRVTVSPGVSPNRSAP